MEPYYNKLRELVRTMSQFKVQKISELPNYGHEGMYFQNDMITTGFINNDTEFKVHLLTGRFIYYKKEHAVVLDVTADDFPQKLMELAKEEGYTWPEKFTVTAISKKDMKDFHVYAVEPIHTLEAVQSLLNDHFSYPHLWPHNFDYSLEWYYKHSDDDFISMGVNPACNEFATTPYFYTTFNPAPETIKKEKLHIGEWEKEGVSVRADWQDLLRLPFEKRVQTIVEMANMIHRHIA